MSIDNWSTDESQNIELDGADVSRRSAPADPANELTRKLMAGVAALSARMDGFVGEDIQVDGVSIVNNDGTLSCVDVALDGDTTDLLTSKIEELEAAATAATESAAAAETYAEQAAASAEDAAAAIATASQAAQSAVQSASLAAQAAIRAQAEAIQVDTSTLQVVPEPLLNWQKTESAGAVTCYPVPNTALEPVVTFGFTETAPASGSKGPENPSMITGVSSVKVTRCGKNLLATPYAQGPSYTSRGFTATENSDGSITWSGTTDNSGTCHFRLNSDYSFKLCSGVAYIASLAGPANQNIMLQAFNSAGQIAFTAYSGDSPVTVSVNEDKYVTLRVSAAKEAGTLDNVTVYPQLELGATATAFEPYEGTDYAVQLGNIYYGGTVDLATGVMTVTRAGIALDGTEDWYNFRQQIDAPGTYRAQIQLQNSGKSADAGFACSHYTSTHSISANAAGPGIYVSAFGDFVLFTNYTTLSDLTSWLASQKLNGTPVTAAWNIAAPYTVQLTPTQILSLAQADKYTPRLNTVYTDAQAVQVGYAKSPIQTEYELTQAIIATEGGE